MTPTDQKVTLRIERMGDGGFVVYDASAIHYSDGRYCGPLFASTDIAESLSYIRKKLTPVCQK